MSNFLWRNNQICTNKAQVKCSFTSPSLSPGNAFCAQKRLGTWLRILVVCLNLHSRGSEFSSWRKLLGAFLPLTPRLFPACLVAHFLLETPFPHLPQSRCPPNPSFPFGPPLGNSICQTEGCQEAVGKEKWVNIYWTPTWGQELSWVLSLRHLTATLNLVSITILQGKQLHGEVR